MLRVYCDLQDCTEDGRCWILLYDGKPLAEQTTQLGLKEGDRVLLYMDGEDYEVEATLFFNQTHEYFLGEKLCALLDDGTFRRP